MSELEATEREVYCKKLSCFLDFFIIVILITLSALIHSVLPHWENGFYCNDPSISHKFIGDTINPPLLLSTVILGPLFIICVVEMTKHKYSIREKCCLIYLWYRKYLLGFLFCCLTILSAKMMFGEPRPHFLDTCKPDAMFNCTTGEYITKYKCTNDVSQQRLSDSIRSFPSGHAVVSFYAALFCFRYTQRRITNLSCSLIKPVLHIFFLSVASCYSLSRISDKRHFWWDVLVGILMGVGLAIYVIKEICKDFKTSEKTRDISLEEKTCLSCSV